MNGFSQQGKAVFRGIALVGRVQGPVILRFSSEDLESFDFV